MTLRNSPLMTRKSGAKTWSPDGQRRTKINAIGRSVKLELSAKFGGIIYWIAVFLFIEHNGLPYTGSIYFDDPMFCHDIYTLLQTRWGG